MNLSVLYKIIFLILVLFGAGCDKTNPVVCNQTTDYANPDNWQEINPTGNHAVDVFFLLPTTYTGNDTFCRVDDPLMRDGAVRIRSAQTSVFDGLANVYMPYYRQANAAIILTSTYSKQIEFIADTPAKDCIAAFEYYLEHYNNDKPFILAGHSQGSFVMMFLMNYLKDKPNVLSRMVAAYPIGIGITKDYMNVNPHLKFAQRADDTGVIISWNIEGAGVTAKNPVVYYPEQTLAINPITWKVNEEHASQLESLGSSLTIDGKLQKVPQYADAQIDLKRGVVVCTTSDPGVNSSNATIFPEGVYHSLDYSLYYYDFKNNIDTRIKAYLTTSEKHVL